MPETQCDDDTTVRVVGVAHFWGTTSQCIHPPHQHCLTNVRAHIFGYLCCWGGMATGTSECYEWHHYCRNAFENANSHSVLRRAVSSVVSRKSFCRLHKSIQVLRIDAADGRQHIQKPFNTLAFIAFPHTFSELDNNRSMAKVDSMLGTRTKCDRIYHAIRVKSVGYARSVRLHILCKSMCGQKPGEIELLEQFDRSGPSTIFPKERCVFVWLFTQHTQKSSHTIFTKRENIREKRRT